MSKEVEDVDTSFKEFLSETNEQFSFEIVTQSQVFMHLTKLCKSKATGLDSISARLLRETPDLIADSLCQIFNKSVVTGIFPDEWKNSRITPVFKNAGKRTDPSNYRPISIIPVVAKVFERIIYDQLYKYLAVNNLLSSHQSGFRSFHSTVTALLEATDSWSLNIDRGFVNAVVFLDLKKAFDTVDHNILLSKLQFYGIKGTALEWFSSYLNNRTQTCQVNCYKSSERFLQCGVPQGTILGPLLFLLYINDLPNCLHYSQPRMYADDTSITFASNNVDEIDECINSDLEEIRLWLAANKLTLNLTKTEFLLIGSRQRLSNLPESLAVRINQSCVEQVSTAKSLGVYIDQNLNWETHIRETSKKIASGISAIKRIRKFVPREILLTIYNSLIQPHFDYCSVVWGCCSKGLSQKLQKLQNRAARIITFSNYDSNVDELLRNLNWKKLDHQRAVNKAIMMYNTVNNQTPDYISSRFFPRNERLTYNLRNVDCKLSVLQPRTNYGKRSFSYSGAVLWNGLPNEIKQSTSLNDFKTKLRNHTFKSEFI